MPGQAVRGFAGVSVQPTPRRPESPLPISVTQSPPPPQPPEQSGRVEIKQAQIQQAQIQQAQIQQAQIQQPTNAPAQAHLPLVGQYPPLARSKELKLDELVHVKQGLDDIRKYAYHRRTVRLATSTAVAGGLVLGSLIAAPFSLGLTAKLSPLIGALGFAGVFAFLSSSKKLEKHVNSLNEKIENVGGGLTKFGLKAGYKKYIKRTDEIENEILTSGRDLTGLQQDNAFLYNLSQNLKKAEEKQSVRKTLGTRIKARVSTRFQLAESPESQQERVVRWYNGVFGVNIDSRDENQVTYMRNHLESALNGQTAAPYATTPAVLPPELKL